MFAIEKLCKGIAQNVTKNMDCDEDKQAIVEYGAFCLLQTLWGILVVIAFALVFNVLIESLIICFSISFLRKYSGGVHASSPNSCAVIGAIICVGLATLTNKVSVFLNITTIIIIAAICFIYSYYIIKKLAPVDSPAKPIKKEEKKKRLKKQSINIVFFMYCASFIFLIISSIQHSQYLLKYMMCIYLGVAWQAFTLTSIAHVIIKKVDYIFIKIFSIFSKQN